MTSFITFAFLSIFIDLAQLSEKSESSESSILGSWVLTPLFICALAIVHIPGGLYISWWPHYKPCPCGPTA